MEYLKSLENEFHELAQQSEKNIEEINLLEENEAVKKYIELKRKNEILFQQQFDVYKSMKFYEYKFCEHILVYSAVDCYRDIRYCGCIKCGLDSSAFLCRKENLSLAQQMMFEYLTSQISGYTYMNIKGKKLNIVCDLDLAQAIYSKIKEVHPNIDDDKAIKYFEIALDNIRKIKVSDERKTQRAKRLSLDSKFKGWNAKDVCVY